MKFAFYSDGVQPRDLLKNVRKAVEAGLPPTRRCGRSRSTRRKSSASRPLGSIETGKIANLVVTDGDLFGEKTKVKMVFVDGDKFEVRDTPPGPRRRQRRPPR